MEEIVFVGTGATPNTKVRSNYENGNIAWINSSATNCPYISKPSAFITSKALNTSNCQVYPIGTIIVAMYGEGKTRGQVSELCIPAATNQACAALLPIDIDTKPYIKLYMTANYLRLRTLAVGGNQPNLNLSSISSYIVPLPPLAEQVRIVSEVEKWMAIIDEVEAGKVDVERLITQAKSKILDLAIRGKLVEQDENDEPASELLKRINPNWQPSDKSHYEQLPDSWEVTSLGEVCKLYNGDKGKGKRIYLDAKYLRGKTDGTFLNEGNLVQRGDYVVVP